MTTARRTQAQRRASSRQKILDAAVACLAERGYAGTTFPEVLARAGLSNGAMWRHFRSKAELLAAAVLHAEHGLAPDVGDHDATGAADDHPGRSAAELVDAAVAHLWDYARTPAFQALIELLRASRSDAELRAALVSRDQDSAEVFFDSCAQLLGPDLATHPDFHHNTRMLGLALYGTALTENLRSPRQEELLLGELTRLAHQLFQV